MLHAQIDITGMLWIARGLDLIQCVKVHKNMNGEQIIPPITDPLGRSWRQPHRRFIELDNTHALMSEQTFKGLAEYSTSIPTGVYDGKMWKGYSNGEWYLVWFAPDKEHDKVRIEKRKILIA